MEKNAPKFKLNKKLLAIAGGVLAVVILAVVLLWPANIVSELKVEAGRESISANEFRKADKGIDAQFVSDMTAVDLKTIGTYPVRSSTRTRPMTAPSSWRTPWPPRARSTMCPSTPASP